MLKSNSRDVASVAANTPVILSLNSGLTFKTKNPVDTYKAKFQLRAT